MQYNVTIKNKALAQEEVSYPIDVAEMHAMKGYSLIKAWRIYLHETKKELADALNITQGAFLQIEKKRPQSG